jgi:hypothetical protein
MWLASENLFMGEGSESIHMTWKMVPMILEFREIVQSVRSASISTISVRVPLG